MISFLRSIFGDMTTYLIMALIEVLIFWVYAFIFCSRSRKRSLFPLRAVTLVLLSVVLCVPIAALRSRGETLWIRMAVEILYTLAEFGCILLLYREDAAELLMLFTGVTVARSFSGNLIPLIRNLFGQDDMSSISLFSDYVPLRDWPLYLLLQLVLLLLTARLFRTGRKNLGVRLDLNSALLLTGITVVLKCVLSPVARQYQQTSRPLSMVIRVLMMLLYLTVLAARTGMLGRRRLETELRISDELLRTEKKRYEEMRDSIEIINMRCHDLKQQLSSLQNKLTEQETTALREAIEIYDANIHTGSEIVDTVLYQKQLIAKKNAIILDWMCDGAAVTFMEPSRLYALLSNALENAIEAVMPLPDAKRVINLYILRSGNEVVIETVNYYDPGRAVTNGTSKDGKGQHGFGMKSMRFISEAYGGSVDWAAQGEMFRLTIRIPAPADSCGKETD